MFRQTTTILSIVLLAMFISGCGRTSTPQSDSYLAQEEEQYEHISSRDTLVGNWRVVTGDVAEIELEDSGSYYTYLHDRPFDFGVWEFRSGTLHLLSDAGDAHSKTFTSIKQKEDSVMKLQFNSSTHIWAPIIQE